MSNPPSSKDDIRDGIITSIIGIFVLEMGIYSYCQDSYLFSFYFFMDFIGTFSMLLDISWITDNFDNSNTRSASYLRAIRAARLGARVGRLLRFMKFLKYLRYLPCFQKKAEKKSPLYPSFEESWMIYRKLLSGPWRFSPSRWSS